jgi:kumamolisin
MRRQSANVKRGIEMQTNSLMGSERQPMRGARAVGKADPKEKLEVTILLRRGNADKLREKVGKLANGEDAGGVLSRAEFEQQYSASDEDIAAIRKFAAANGLAVARTDAGRRSVWLSGTVAQFNAAFGVDLQKFDHPGGSYRGRVGSIHLPADICDRVEAVLGLDNRPAATTHFRLRSAPKNGAAINLGAKDAGPKKAASKNAAPKSAASKTGGRKSSAASAPTSYTPLQIASFYDFPDGTGQGQCVGIIELGGGERPVDLKTYFAQLGVNPAPNVITVPVDGAKNKPTGNPNGPDGEVMLDIEVVGAIAPQARIAVYFAPNTDAGFLDAITTALHDSANNPSVLSISWGGPESTWTPQAMNAFDSAFQAAAAMGVTVCVASGDNGATDGVSDGQDHVDFPASSPHVLACGGSSLQASGNEIASETVWNDGPQGGAGGGGVSGFFALPPWQNGLQVTRTSGGSSALTMRGVPDVCGDADPETGYVVRIHGSNTVIGGTSAVAPLWAGLIARINAAKGSPAGFINPTLYQNPAAFHPITEGNNGDFAASEGWNACAGLGSPIGEKIAGQIASSTRMS